MFGKTASLYGVVRSASGRLLPPGDTRVLQPGPTEPAEAFCGDHHQAQAV
jgi:hypothetical protein